jgi:hypothetical protein
VAACALHQLLSMGAAGGAAGVAALLAQVPAASAAAFQKAGLSPLNGGWV